MDSSEPGSESVATGRSRLLAVVGGHLATLQRWHMAHVCLCPKEPEACEG